MGAGALQGHRLNNTVNTQGCTLCNFPLDIATQISPPGSLLPPAKEAPHCVCFPAFGNSLAGTMGPLLPYLCLLGFVGLVFIIIIFSSMLEMEPHSEHFLSKRLFG